MLDIFVEVINRTIEFTGSYHLPAVNLFLESTSDNFGTAVFPNDNFSCWLEIENAFTQEWTETVS